MSLQLSARLGCSQAATGRHSGRGCRLARASVRTAGRESS